MTEIKAVVAGDLLVGYEETGATNKDTAILLHGFPYDPRCYDEATDILVANGCRVIVPYLRGYGATQFRTENTIRSGQQAALGNDLLQLMDALGIDAAVLAGYDWGGRAACIVAALWPDRCNGLVTGNNPYNIQDIAVSAQPAEPQMEHRYWYQYYMHTERGRVGVAQNRYAFCRLLWELWSPSWKFSEHTYARSAQSFENPDFVDVVIHSYRHRYMLAAGDPALEDIEQLLAVQPDIAVPTIALRGMDDGVEGALESSVEAGRKFTGPFQWHAMPGVGHNIPQEAPAKFSEAVLSLVPR